MSTMSIRGASYFYLRAATLAAVGSFAIPGWTPQHKGNKACLASAVDSKTVVEARSPEPGTSA